LVSRLNKFIQNLHTRNSKGRAQGIFLAAFGKHPGWDDHIDDIGLETDVLVAVKRILYIQGIGRNIDTGNWGKLEQEQQAEGFAHTFVWCLNQDIVVGRLWTSQDGKGRSSYPMIVCVHCDQLPLWWMINTILPQLKKIEESCLAVSSAVDVRGIIEKTQHEFRQLAQDYESVSQDALPRSCGLKKLAELPEMGPNRQGLYRVFYHLDREAVQEGRKANKDQPTFVRVPSMSSSPEHALLWIEYLLTKTGPNTPILALMPVANPWTDIIIGEATEAQLFCLRASPKAMPLTSSIPYNIDSEFIHRVNQHVDGI